MRATLVCLLLGSLSSTLSVNAEIKVAAAHEVQEPAQGDTLPTSIIQVAQVVVVDQDVLSIAADLAVAAAAAAAAEEEDDEENGIAVETEEDQHVALTEEEEDVTLEGEDVALERAAFEDATADDAAVDDATVDDAAVEGDIVVEEFTAGDVSKVDQMLQQQQASTALTTSWSVSGTTSYPIVIDTEFTFSPITLAPESSRSIHHTTPTQKPSAPSTVKKVKSSATTTSSSSSMYWTATLILSFCLLGQYF